MILHQSRTLWWQGCVKHSLRSQAHRSERLNSTAVPASPRPVWCNAQVVVPDINWPEVINADTTQLKITRTAQGYQRMELPQGLQALLVDDQAHLPAALQELQATMQDPYVGVDLEWRPDFIKGHSNPVALVQLASSTTALLVRTCRMHHKLPASIKTLMQDPAVHLVGLGWGTSDERKMRSSFGIGRRDFGHFIALDTIGKSLGYDELGLSALASRVLGHPMSKSKKLTMSNWEAAVLSPTQVKYAALDALLVGGVLRTWRLWRSTSTQCQSCHNKLGVEGSVPTSYECGDCGLSHRSYKGHMRHCVAAEHKPLCLLCEGCGCVRPIDGRR